MNNKPEPRTRPIQLRLDVKATLDKLKIHKRETYCDVIERLILKVENYEGLTLEELKK